MTAQDFEAIKASCKATIKLMMSSQQVIEDEELCSRGLEGKTREGAKLRIKNRYKVKHAVLREQEAQRQAGVYNDLFLAEVSQAKTTKCVERALENARNDEREAVEFSRC